jgi:hypothetical protein
LRHIALLNPRHQSFLLQFALNPPLFQAYSDVTFALNIVFIALYCTEITLKIIALGVSTFYDPWNIFDQGGEYRPKPLIPSGKTPFNSRPC